jgi:hypothetical protein
MFEEGGVPAPAARVRPGSALSKRFGFDVVGPRVGDAMYVRRGGEEPLERRTR